MDPQEPRRFPYAAPPVKDCISQDEPCRNSELWGAMAHLLNGKEDDRVLMQSTRLEGCRIIATDGSIGKVDELYFDDHNWVARYVVVDTGGWLKERGVLISPHAVDCVDLAERTVKLGISREKVKRSPDIGTDLPVSRKLEADYLGYYGYAQYWPTSVTPAAGPLPPVTQPNAPRMPAAGARKLPHIRAESHSDMHLRSSSEVTGYRIGAKDRRIGHVVDFLVDDESWVIRYLILQTGHWPAEKRVLLMPEHIREVDWARGEVAVDRTRSQIQALPEFDPAHLPNGNLEGPLSPSRIADHQ